MRMAVKGEPTQTVRLGSRVTFWAPFSCAQSNCGFLKTLDEFHECRFPPSCLNNNPQEGLRPTSTSCVRACIYDITEEEGNATAQPTPYSEYGTCPGFEYDGTAYEQGEYSKGGVYCTAGCGFGKGGCISKQELPSGGQEN